jgi:hypothetical protein
MSEQQKRPAQRVWPTHWLPPGTPTPSCQAGRHGAEAGEAKPYLTNGDRPHALASGLLEVDEGRGTQRRYVGEMATHEEVQEFKDGGGGGWGGAGGRTNVIVRPTAETWPRGAREALQDALEDGICDHKGGGRRRRNVKRGSGGCRAARLARVKAEDGARGTVSKTLAEREMLPMMRWWWARAAVLWGGGAL